MYCAFLFDTDIIGPLQKDDRRLTFIHESVKALSDALSGMGSALHVLHGRADAEIPEFCFRFGIEAVFCNRDYEPSAADRDARVGRRLAHLGVDFHDFKDQVIFDREEVVSASGKPYSVFTPYRKAWLARLEDSCLTPYPVEEHMHALEKCAPFPVPSLESLGFEKQTLSIPPGMSGADALLSEFEERIDRYQELRDYPAIDGTSRLSAHLRFGTISVRRLAKIALRRSGSGAEAFLSELAWRDFFQMILDHHPQVAQGHAFRSEYEYLPFENDTEKYQAWRTGQTGYPLIDAAMRQLASEGFMHNRLRMIAASFLVKDLHVDWRWGEKHFAEKLLDFDFASNNGGWQWAASTGCDAQPWFRIFNPVTQSEKFDPEGTYIRRHVPELDNCPGKWIHAPWKMPDSERKRYEYPDPIVCHSEARKKALEIYGR